MTNIPQNQILSLCQQTETEIVLVAPFMKETVVNTLFKKIPLTVKIRGVTRWRPEEIAGGISDLEVFDLFSARKNAELFIQPLLHAKYFRFDANCLVGSANLTQRALGWYMPPNLELLVLLSSDRIDLVEFEKHIFITSVKATVGLKEEISKEADKLKGAEIRYVFEEDVLKETDMNIANNIWLPLCSSPEYLFRIYREQNLDDFINTTLRNGQEDIQVLISSSGLSQYLFQATIASSLQQSFIGQLIYENANESISMDRGTKLISKHIPEHQLVYTPKDHWKVLKKWFLYFLPQIYREPRGSSDLQKGREIGSYSG